MRASTIAWLACGALILAGATSFPADEADNKMIEEARAAVVGLAEGKGDAKNIARKHEHEHVAAVFKLRSKGGIGVGAKPGPALEDGIEKKIYALAKKPLSAEQLKQEANALVKMLEITRVVGEINAYAEKPANKDPLRWKMFNEEMIRAAEAAQNAVKRGDPGKVKAAFERLSTSCENCHWVGR